jgi:hypothetical protein
MAYNEMCPYSLVEIIQLSAIPMSVIKIEQIAVERQSAL